MIRMYTTYMRLELSVVQGTDVGELAHAIMNYLLADEINGLPDTFSIDGIEVDW